MTAEHASGVDAPAATHLCPPILYQDADATGVGYRVNDLKYFERAQTLWMTARGLSHRGLADNRGATFTLTDAEIALRAPACLDDVLDVSTAVSERRRVRVVLAQDIRRGRIKAQFTSACVRLHDLKPRALPAALGDHERL